MDGHLGLPLQSQDSGILLKAFSHELQVSQDLQIVNTCIKILSANQEYEYLPLAEPYHKLVRCPVYFSQYTIDPVYMLDQVNL